MTTIPTQGPIDLSTIRDAINAAGGHATNDLMSFFSAENVAEGSPRKPISLGVDFAQDFDSTKPNYSANFWKDGGRYGWILDGAKVANSNSPFVDIYNKYDGDMNGWQRSLPTGGAESPYRLGDFLGYVSHAEKLAENFHVTARIGSSGSFVDYPNITDIWIDEVADKPLKLLIFSIGTPQEGSESLELAEIDPIKDYYFGVIARYSYGGVAKRFTSTEKLSQGSSSVAIDITDLGVGFYTLVPFICDRAIGVTDSDTTTMVVYTLPHVAPINLRILQHEVEDGVLEFVSASVAIERRSGSDAIVYSVTIKNDSSVAETIYDAQLVLCYAATGDEIRTIYIPSFEVPAKGQYTQTATEVQTVYLPTPPDGFTAKIYFSEYIENVEGIEVTDRRNI